MDKEIGCSWFLSLIERKFKYFVLIFMFISEAE